MKTFLLTFLSYLLVYGIFLLILKRFIKRDYIPSIITLGMIIIVILSIRYAIKKDQLDYKNISIKEIRIGRYTTDNEFILYPSGFAGRKCMLYHSSSIIASKTKEEFQSEFQKLTKGKKLKAVFVENKMPQDEPWSVILLIDTLNVNDFLVASSFGASNQLVNISSSVDRSEPEDKKEIIIQGDTSNREINGEDVQANGIHNELLDNQHLIAKILNWKIRKELMPVWIYLIIGAFGATSFGMMFNKRPAGFLFFPIIYYFVVKDFYIGIVNDLPLWKPIIVTAWILLTGGVGAKSNRQFLEKNPEYK